jgi:exodeoxyribonuclease VII small subunit
MAVSSDDMTKATATAAPPDTPITYEAALSELERLVAAMEGGQMPLDRLIENYQRGAALLTLCRSRLDSVEQQVKVLEDGQLRPWSEA